MRLTSRTGSIPVSGTIYRGVEQLVARRAHNPEAVRFKSHPRNQTKETVTVWWLFSFARMQRVGVCTSLRPPEEVVGLEPERA